MSDFKFKRGKNHIKRLASGVRIMSFLLFEPKSTDKKSALSSKIVGN